VVPLDEIPTLPMGDGEVRVTALPAASLPPLRRGGPRLDALVDAIATLTLDAPMSGDHLLMHLPPTRRAGSKPVLVEGLRSDCGEWEQPQAGVLYTELQAGVLMANRTGGLNEIEYSEFVQKVQAMADALPAATEFPDMLDIVARARELDAFAGAHDAQLAMRLAGKGSAWSLGYVQQQAQRHGFAPGALLGRFVLPSPDEGAPPLLTLQFDAQAAFAEDEDQATLRELLLCFDVPPSKRRSRHGVLQVRPWPCPWTASCWTIRARRSHPLPLRPSRASWPKSMRRWPHAIWLRGRRPRAACSADPPGDAPWHSRTFSLPPTRALSPPTTLRRPKLLRLLSPRGLCARSCMCMHTDTMCWTRRASRMPSTTDSSRHCKPWRPSTPNCARSTHQRNA
jgi:hypothetical protein